MDPKEREELSELMREQQRLRGELTELSHKIQELGSRLGQNKSDSERTTPILEKTPTKEIGQVSNDITETPLTKRTTPPPVPKSTKTPPLISYEVAELQELQELQQPETAVKSAMIEQATLTSQAAAKEKAHANTPEKAASDWELNLGKVWFVRIGVGLLLTGLVFLSLYAYKNWIFNASALLKVSFFFSVSLTMVTGGYVIERKRKHLRQYGQALSAGGLAAGYYTLYAAHFVPALKVIGSPIVAAILLCLWAGGMLAYSAWRQGRILAVMSIGLAYYGTVINPSGWISLFSSLVLSVSAILLLVRYRWVWVGLVGLIAAYLSHGLWAAMFLHEVTETVRITYLICTWLIFCVAMQATQSQTLARNLRRAMVGINNTAFWILTVFHMPDILADQFSPIPHEHIGWISIGIGVVWMLIGLFTSKRGGWRLDYVAVWSFQGLLFATLGLMIQASGYQRFLLLAAEACVLLAASRWLAPKWTKITAMIVFAASSTFAWTHGLGAGDDLPSEWPGYLFTALFGFAFVILMRRDVELSDHRQVLKLYGKQHRYMPVGFALVPWAILIFGAIMHWDGPYPLIGLCSVALLVVGTRLIYERRETLDASVYTPLVVAMAGYWLLRWRVDLSNASSALIASLLLTYWLLADFLRFSTKPLHRGLPLLSTRWAEWLAAIVLTFHVGRWISSVPSNLEVWTASAPWIAVAGSGAYLLTRRYSLAFLFGIFHVGGIFAMWLGADRLDSGLCAMPVLAVLAHLAMGERWFSSQTMSALRPWAGIGIFLSFAGFVEVADWPEPMIWIALSSMLWTAYCMRINQGIAAITGGLVPLILISLGYAFEDADGWIAYLCLPLLPITSLVIGQFQFNSKNSWAIFRRVGGFIGLLLLGLKLGEHTYETFETGQAIAWGLYAMLLFGIGLIFSDKLFRRFGLFFLAVAVLHIIAIDAMKLDTLGRILSFLVLGVVLMLLGFLYNQYQDKIRKYL